MPAATGPAAAVPLSGLPAGRGSTPLRVQIVRRMQQVQGNRFVQRYLARDHALQRQPETAGATTPSAPLPIDQAAQTQATNWQPQHAHAYENPNLLPIIYTHRDEMLQRFLQLYRRLDAQDVSRLPESEREAPLNTARQQIQDEITRLGALQAGGDADAQAQIDTLRGLLERGQGTGRQALEMARTWAGRSVTDLHGPELLAQVQAQFGLSNVPAWARPIILEYGGMRYQSGHGTWVPPQELLWQIIVNTPSPDRPANFADSRAGRQMHREIQGLANEQALGRIQAMRAAGQIPDGPWHQIVRLTDLRQDTADANWESSRGEEIQAPWNRILRQWRSGQTTAWRAELMRRNALVTTQVVCNELAEAVARQRGIRLPGGITANVAVFQRQAEQAARQAGAGAQQAEALAQAAQQSGAQQGATTEGQVAPAEGTGGTQAAAQAQQPQAAQPAPSPAPFIVHGPRVGTEHLIPGAALFFLAGSSRGSGGWTANPQPHDRVAIVPGVQYPIPCDTGGSGPCGEGTVITDGLQQDGWTYHVGADQIYRSRTTTIPERPAGRRGRGAAAAQSPPEPQPLPAGEEIRHYMKWSHQATILRVSGNTVVTIETTDIGAGVRDRTVASLRSPFVFVAWAPGS